MRPQDGDDDYSLLVNLKRLYELQLSRSVPIESLFGDLTVILQNLRNTDDEVVKWNFYNYLTDCFLTLFLAFAYNMVDDAHTGCQFPASQHVFACSMVLALYDK